MKFKLLLLVGFLLIGSSSALAQGWQMDVSMDLQTSECFEEHLTSASWSYTGGGSGSATLSTSQLYLATFTITGTGDATSGTINMNASGVCDGGDTPTYPGMSIGGSIGIAVSMPAGSGCTSKYYPVNPIPPPGSSGLAVTITFSPRYQINDPVITNCKTITMSSPTASCGYYQWEMSEDGSTNWKSLGVSSASSQTINMSVVQNLSTKKFGVHYIRVGATGRMSPVKSFYIDAPPPHVSFGKQNISCYNGSDAILKLTVSSDISAIDNFYIKAFHQDNPSSTNPDAQIVNAAGNYFEVTKTNLITADTRLKPGNWSFIVENNKTTATYGSCGATFTNAINITEPPELKITAVPSITNVSCNTADTGNKSDGAISLTLQNGTAPYSYAFSTDGGTSYTDKSVADVNTLSPALTGFTKGTYKIVAKYQSNSVTCVSQPVDATINEPGNITVTQDVKADVTCKDTNKGSSIAVTVTNGNDGFSYSWTGPSGYTSGSEDISALYAGGYALVVTDAKSCQDNSYSTTIGQPTDKLQINTAATLMGGFEVDCNNEGGAITLSYLSQPNAISSIVWKMGASTFAPSDPLHPDNLSAGNYSVTVTDNSTCSATSSITLDPHPGITTNVSATSSYNGYNTKCNSPLSDEGAGMVTGVTNAFGTLTYVWTHDTGLNSPNVSALPPGTYHVEVTDANHCTDGADLVIIPPPAILPNLTVTSNYNGAQIKCPTYADGVMEAFPTNGLAPYSYTWLHDGSNTSKLATGLTQGSYKVIVTDAYDCVAEQTVSISDPAAMQLTFNKTSYNGSDLTCYGASDGAVQLTVLNALGAPASLAYDWNNGAATKDINTLTKGDYTVTVTDGNTCTKSATVSIIGPDELIVTMKHVNDFNSFDITCNGLSEGEALADVTGGTGGPIGYSYVWSNSITTSNNPGLAAGDYSVSVHDLNGCSTTGNITISQPALLVVSATIDNPVSCFGLADGQVTINGNGGVAPYKYALDAGSWDDPNTITGLSVGDHDFHIKDNNGCQSQIMKTMTQPAILQLTFTDKVDAACNDAVGSVKAVVSGGNGGYSYSWSDEFTGDPMNTGESLINAIAGIYRVDILDNKNCAISDVTNISSIGGATFDVTNITPVTCFGYSNGAASIVVTSGTAPYSYQWSDGQRTDQAINLVAGRYFATVIDGFACKTIQQVIINTPAELTASHTRTLPLCVGDCNGIIQSVAAGGTAPYSYQWMDLNINTSVANNLCAGLYALKITDSHACVLQENVLLNNPDALQINASLSDPTCLGRCDGVITANGQGGTGPYLFTWEDQSTNASLGSLCAGTYKVNMKDAHNCIADNAFTLQNGKPLPLDMGSKATLCVGQTKMLDAGAQWVVASWTSSTGFASDQKKISIKEPGDYFFKGIDARSCVAVDTFHLETATDLIKAEFLMPATAVVGDTIVAIDVSWPLPERIEWSYPASFDSIPSPMDEFLFAKVTQAGTYTIGLKTFLAECRDLREKTLTVVAEDDAGTGGRLGFEEFIVEYTLSPNPTDGRFSAYVQLSEEAPIRLRVIQHPAGILFADTFQELSTEHHVDFDLPLMPAGLYVLLLDVNGKQRFIRFVKY